MVKMNHHAPTRKSTRRSEKVVLFREKMTIIQTHCRKRPALYPMPIPRDEICVDSCSSMDVAFLAGAGVRRAEVESCRCSSPEASGASDGWSSGVVDANSGVKSGV